MDIGPRPLQATRSGLGVRIIANIAVMLLLSMDSPLV